MQDGKEREGEGVASWHQLKRVVKGGSRSATERRRRAGTTRGRPIAAGILASRGRPGSGTGVSCCSRAPRRRLGRSAEAQQKDKRAGGRERRRQRASERECQGTHMAPLSSSLIGLPGGSSRALATSRMARTHPSIKLTTAAAETALCLVRSEGCRRQRDASDHR